MSLSSGLWPRRFGVANCGRRQERHAFEEQRGRSALFGLAVHGATSVGSAEEAEAHGCGARRRGGRGESARERACFLAALVTDSRRRLLSSRGSVVPQSAAAGEVCGLFTSPCGSVGYSSMHGALFGSERRGAVRGNSAGAAVWGCPEETGRREAEGQKLKAPS